MSPVLLRQHLLRRISYTHKPAKRQVTRRKKQQTGGKCCSMKDKKSNSDVRAYMAESLMTLMGKKPYADISISEITRKAGVNRSTYYRNFNSKDDIITFYFKEKIVFSFEGNVMDNTASPKTRLLKLFKHYENYKNDLVLIYKNGLFHLILDAFNSLVITSTETQSDQEICRLYWYAGAIFNSLLFWVSGNMNKSPETMSKLYASLMPDCWE
jgi:AcrR family transcriptional regulator